MAGAPLFCSLPFFTQAFCAQFIHMQTFCTQFIRTQFIRTQFTYAYSAEDVIFYSPTLFKSYVLP
jgi:hypothetical protein